MFTAGMRNCAIAVHFRPRGFAWPFACCFAFGLPHPPTSWFMVGPGVQVSIYLFFTENLSVTVAMRRWPVGGCHGYPLYLLFAHTCSLPALLSIGTYPSFWILPIDKIINYVLVKKILLITIKADKFKTIELRQQQYSWVVVVKHSTPLPQFKSFYKYCIQRNSVKLKQNWFKCSKQ